MREEEEVRVREIMRNCIHQSGGRLCKDAFERWVWAIDCDCLGMLVKLHAMSPPSKANHEHD